MPAGGATLRSTAVGGHQAPRSAQPTRSSGSHHRLSGPSSYVFAPSWMLRNGKKPTSSSSSSSSSSHSHEQLAFTSFSGGHDDEATSNHARMSLSARRAADHRIAVSTTLRSSNSSPYPSSSDEPHNDSKPDDSEFPTLTPDEHTGKRNDGRSAWSNAHLIKEKVLSPTRVDSVSSMDAGPSPQDMELERLKALVPKQRATARKLGSSRTSANPSPSPSSSSSHRNSNSNHHPHRTSKSMRAVNSASPSPLTKAPLKKETPAAIVKLPENKRMSAGDSSSSINDDASQSSASSSLVHQPPWMMEAAAAAAAPMSPAAAAATSCVDERDKQHFLSWLYAWTCRPGVEWRQQQHNAHAVHRGEYSYFGPLGTKGDASLFYQGSILVHSLWYNAGQI